MATTVAGAELCGVSGLSPIRTDVQEMGPAWRVRPFLPADTRSICSWVDTRRLLQLVSSDDADGLTPTILRGWIKHAIATIVMLSGETDEPVGFCTLSASEVPDAPPHFLELCHLIVDPRYRYLFIGPRICKAAKSIARHLAFCQLYGRVVPQHRYGIALARYEKFEELTLLPPYLPQRFRWFRYAIAPVARDS